MTLDIESYIMELLKRSRSWQSKQGTSWWSEGIGPFGQSLFLYSNGETRLTYHDGFSPREANLPKNWMFV